MTRINGSVVVLLMLGALVTGVAGCKKEGPAEHAGREIDKTFKKAEQQIEKAGDKIKKSAKELKK